MYIPGQIRIFNALNSDGYSTGNASASGNDESYIMLAAGPYANMNHSKASGMHRHRLLLQYLPVSWTPVTI